MISPHHLLLVVAELGVLQEASIHDCALAVAQEFGQSFNWDGYNQTMSHIAETLRPHGKGLGISINSGCEAGPNSSSDPSCDPAYRNTPWAAVLTDMGTCKRDRGPLSGGQQTTATATQPAHR